jgi:hypothetical protein
VPVDVAIDVPAGVFAPGADDARTFAENVEPRTEFADAGPDMLTVGLEIAL